MLYQKKKKKKWPTNNANFTFIGPVHVMTLPHCAQVKSHAGEKTKRLGVFSSLGTQGEFLSSRTS